jgi:hypothetical protein
VFPIVACAKRICQEPGWIALEIFVLIAYSFLSILTARRAERAGRDRTVWLFYAAIAPVISLVHLTLVERRRERHHPNPAD